MRTFGNESAENYLETILVLSKKLPVVRSVDIANELGFKKSSVSVAMKNLREKKLYYCVRSRFHFPDRFRARDRRMIYERHEFLGLTGL